MANRTLNFVGLVISFLLLAQNVQATNLNVEVKGRQISLVFPEKGKSIVLTDNHKGFLPVGEFDGQNSLSHVRILKIDILSRGRVLQYVWQSDAGDSFEINDQQIQFSTSLIKAIEDRFNTLSYNDFALGLSIYAIGGFFIEIELPQNTRDLLMKRNWCQRALIDPVIRKWKGKVTW